MLYYISLSAVFIKTIRLKYTEYAESEFRSFEFATCKFNRVLPKWCKFTKSTSSQNNREISSVHP